MLKEHSEETTQIESSLLSAMSCCSRVDATSACLLENGVVPDFFSESDLVQLLELEEHQENEHGEDVIDPPTQKKPRIDYNSTKNLDMDPHGRVNHCTFNNLKKDPLLGKRLTHEDDLGDEEHSVKPSKSDFSDGRPLFSNDTQSIPSPSVNLSSGPIAPHGSFKNFASPHQPDPLDSREPNSVFQSRLRANKRYLERRELESVYETKEVVQPLHGKNQRCGMNFFSSDSKIVPDYPTKVDHNSYHKASIEHLMDAFAFETKKRKRLLETSEEGKYVEPRDEDVLLGRGGRANKHPGNERYHQEKAMLQPKYKLASKEDKTDISQDLVDIVHNYGGRFLKFDDQAGKWYEVANIVARRKASQALREESTPEKRAAKRAKYPAKSRAKGSKAASAAAAAAANMQQT